jgi:hypothetical protein
MDECIRYRGRIFTERDIEDVRELISCYPDKSRFFLAKELCRLWGWTQANGTLRDMVCRSLLLKLPSGDLPGPATKQPIGATSASLRAGAKTITRISPIEALNTSSAIPSHGTSEKLFMAFCKNCFEKQQRMDNLIESVFKTILDRIADDPAVDVASLIQSCQKQA